MMQVLEKDLKNKKIGFSLCFHHHILRIFTVKFSKSIKSKKKESLEIFSNLTGLLFSTETLVYKI
jgi:predicted transporter